MSSIRKNFFYNVTYQTLLIILPLITTPYISRILGVNGVGIYSYTYTVAKYFVLFAMLGVSNYGNRCVASIREDRSRLSRIFWQVYGLQFICAMTSCVVYLVYLLIVKQEYFIISLVQGLYVLSSIFDISWFFFGMEEFKVTVTRNIMIRLASVACIFIFVRSESDLWIYTLIMATGTLMSQGYLWLYLHRFVFWVKPKMREVFQHLHAELVLFIPVIAVSLYKMMDKVMLERMCTITQVGYYESVEKIINIPLGVITALGTVMLPRMSNMVARGKVEESRHYIYHSILFAMILAVAMAFGLAGISQDLIPIFLGESYQACILLLKMMTPTICFIAWANVIRTQYLIPNHKDRSYIVSVVLGAIVNLTVNALLIPRMESMGAVIGTICAEMVVCVYQTIAVRKELEIVQYLRTCVPLLLFGFGMFYLTQVISTAYEKHLIALLLEIVLGGITYLLTVGVYLLLIRYEPVLTFFKSFKKNK